MPAQIDDESVKSQNKFDTNKCFSDSVTSSTLDRKGRNVETGNGAKWEDEREK